MITITNQEKLTQVLDFHQTTSIIKNNMFLDCVSLEEKIIKDEKNNVYEHYEIFLAILANVHQTAIATDNFELAKLIIRTYNYQYRQMKNITDATGDEDIMWWLYTTNDYFNLNIQLQLSNYQHNG